MSAQRNYYEILNSTSNATFDELKRNYKQLILQCHPDKLQQDNSEAFTSASSMPANPNVSSHDDGEFVIINEAWNTLKDPIKRKHYDAELLLTKFQAHSNIFEHLTLADMDEHSPENNDNNEYCQDTAETYYAYGCRCGGQYVIDESAATENGLYKDQKRQQKTSITTTDTAATNDCDSTSNNDSIDVADNADVGDNDKVADTNDCEVMVECSECSLVIILSNVKQHQQQNHQQQQSSTLS